MLELSAPELSRRIRRLPLQRWQFYPAKTELVAGLAEATQLSPILIQLLVNRGIETVEQAKAFLVPESQDLPSPNFAVW